MTRYKQPDIIDQLRQAVADSGKTQVEIAEATNLDQGNISKFLHGKRACPRICCGIMQLSRS